MAGKFCTESPVLLHFYTKAEVARLCWTVAELMSMAINFHAALSTHCIILFLNVLGIQGSSAM